MSELCRWLHDQLSQLPMFRFPFHVDDLPQNGIYFFYEEGEVGGHGSDEPRIVRIGSHRGQGNLRSRISETYLLDERRLGFGPDNAKPADRSIFRKNLGRALLNRAGDDYLKIWEIDFTTRRNRDRFRQLRDMEEELRLEESISRLLRDWFSFRVIAAHNQTERRELEKRLIGTVANCELCKPSQNWLGRFSPEPKIRVGNLWQVQHIKGHPVSASDKEGVLRAINSTRAWGNG